MSLRGRAIAYLVALCHIDTYEKSFRLDRVRRFEVVQPTAPTVTSSASER